MGARGSVASSFACIIFLACSDSPEAVTANRQSAVSPAPAPAPPRPSEEKAEPPAALPQPAITASAPTADQIAMAATDFGQPSIGLASSLDVRRWAQEGGNLERVEPLAGSRFLIIEFPAARNPRGQIFYDSNQVSLTVGDSTMRPFAVTTLGANAPALGRTEEGRRVFQREVYASEYAPTPDLPFGIVFEVPAGAASGTLALGARETALFW